MNLIWSDRSWGEYINWQNKDKKVLKEIYIMEWVSQNL